MDLTVSHRIGLSHESRAELRRFRNRESAAASRDRAKAHTIELQARLSALDTRCALLENIVRTSGNEELMGALDRLPPIPPEGSGSVGGGVSAGSSRMGSYNNNTMRQSSYGSAGSGRSSRSAMGGGGEVRGSVAASLTMATQRFADSKGRRSSARAQPGGGSGGSYGSGYRQDSFASAAAPAALSGGDAAGVGEPPRGGSGAAAWPVNRLEASVIASNSSTDFDSSSQQDDGGSFVASSSAPDDAAAEAADAALLADNAAAMRLLVTAAISGEGEGARGGP
jgi:hypothetical protein